MSSRLSIISETIASELLVNLEEMFFYLQHACIVISVSNLQPYIGVLLISERLNLLIKLINLLHMK